MNKGTPKDSPWPRAVLGAVVAFTIVSMWPGQTWNVFVVPAAGYWWMPAEHRTRRNAAIVGWSVGFGVVFLSLVWRVLEP